jgi:hypothetical protein
VLAFSSTQRLSDFLDVNHAGRWRIKLVADRTGLVLLAADLHRDRADGIRLDPKSDGSHGYEAPLSDIVGQLD